VEISLTYGVVGGLYEPMKALLKNSVEAGFIRPENLSLVQILDIPSSANIEEWGPATVKALRDFTFDVRATTTHMISKLTHIPG
jgi:hypothetical protein